VLSEDDEDGHDYNWPQAHAACAPEAGPAPQ
jgi:hypothetical protein